MTRGPAFLQRVQDPAERARIPVFGERGGRGRQLGHGGFVLAVGEAVGDLRLGDLGRRRPRGMTRRRIDPDAVPPPPLRRDLDTCEPPRPLVRSERWLWRTTSPGPHAEEPAVSRPTTA